jgi:hypothetical protein
MTSKESSKMGGLKQVVRGAITKKLDDSPSSSNFDRARRSVGFEKALRQFFLTTTYILGTILLYLVAISYCMKDPKVAEMIRGILGTAPPSAVAPATYESRQSTTGSARKRHAGK